jgi:hypothetical protein
VRERWNQDLKSDEILLLLRIRCYCYFCDEFILIKKGPALLAGLVSKEKEFALQSDMYSKFATQLPTDAYCY